MKKKSKSSTHGRTKERLTKSYNVILGSKKYSVSKETLKKLQDELSYDELSDRQPGNLTIEEVFGDEELTGAECLGGLRYREGMTQVEFAKAIGVTQANLSAMENGKRPIGKEIAKRIEAKFGMNYRYFV